jgi:multiple sugar transport system substrate-binding protein
MEQNNDASAKDGQQPFSRRRLLAGGALVGAGALGLRPSSRAGTLGRRSLATRPRTGSSAKAGAVAFWDMEWGTAAYSREGASLAKKYNAMYPSRPQVVYTAIPWGNQYEVFASAIASHTGPACSSGSGYQAFQFAASGAIQPLDELVVQLKKAGVVADYYPHELDVLKYQGSYVAIPWQVDIRVLYYRKSILKKVGADVPATWDDLLTLGKMLKPKGIYVLNTTGTVAASSWQFSLIPFILGNGGGLFNTNGELDCVTDANLEAVEFLLKLAQDGYVDPLSIGFSSTDFNNAFGSGKAALSYSTPKYTDNFTGSVAADIGIAAPIKSPSGKTGTIYWVNNLMAYKGSYPLEGMYEWYTSYAELMKAYWQTGLVTGLPVRKSFSAIPAVANDPTLAVPLKEWLPVAKTTAALGNTLSPGLNALESGTALSIATQQTIRGTPSAKAILTTLQQAAEQEMK